MLPINWSPGDRQLRSFSHIWLPLFVLAGSALLFRSRGFTAMLMVTVAVGAILAGAASLNRFVARTLFVGMQVATFPIALLTSTVVLAVIYYLVVTPIGVALRVAGRDPLARRQRHAASMWVPVRRDASPERAFRQF